MSVAKETESEIVAAMGRLTLTHSGGRLTDQDFETAEHKMGITFPADLKQLYRLSNGGSPYPSSFLAHDGDYCSINEIHSISGNLQEETSQSSNLEEMYRLYSLYRGEAWYPGDAIPFAVDAGGWPFLYSLTDGNTGKIFLFQADFYDDRERAVLFLANSLCEFLNGLVNHPDDELASA
jgi:cell wall assembly regulator SMI1